MWQGKKVLITGISGFIGSNIAETLVEKGAEVSGITLPELKEERYKILNCDLTNKEETLKVIEESKPEIIFHLAAQPIHSIGEKEPALTFQSNVITTFNLLELVRRNPEIKLIYASTRDLYDPKSHLPFKEDNPLSNKGIYASTKFISECLIRSYFSSYKLPIAIVRASNTFGPKDAHPSRLIPSIINSLLSNKNIELRGNGLSKKDYLFIRDLVNGYIKLAESLFKGENYGEAFNFSGANPHSTLEISQKLLAISGKNLEINFADKESKLQDLQYSSSEKAKNLLNWTQESTLDDGLKETYKWCEENKKNE